MTRCKCGYCKKEFKSKKERKEHREKYPKGKCIDIETESKKEVEEMEKTEEIVQEEEKEAIKEIPKIKKPKEQAKEEWKKYCDVLKKRKEKFLRVLKDAHYQMKEGRELIDIFKVMKQAGLNENKEPRLAIARADLQTCIFEKSDEGAGGFGHGDKDDVVLPQNTFKVHWERQEGEPENGWRINNKRIRTKVPIVPIEILPEGNLSGYYILWETNEWEALPETKDPILLKRISENLFAILGSWDLTDLEQSIIAGGKK